MIQAQVQLLYTVVNVMFMIMVILGFIWATVVRLKEWRASGLMKAAEEDDTVQPVVYYY